jgi:transposase
MKHFEIPLDIEDVTIDKVEFKENGEIIITVTSTVEGTYCHRCGQKITDSYGHDREITLRHLSILGRPTYIQIRPKRYRCRSCSDHPTTTQKSSWYDPRSPHTKAYETHVLLNLVNSTVEDVRIKEGLGYEAVMGIIDRHVSQKVDWSQFSELPIIGVDEITLKKGHRDYVAVITARLAHHQNHILAVLKDRQKATVKEFFSSIPKHLRKTIQVVCTDLYDGYINAAREVFGQRVRIVADRFHVAKLYRKGVDDLRKTELKRLKKTLPKDEYKGLKGAMWALRKNEADLKPDEVELLKKLFKLSPVLGTAYLLCQTLTWIFNQPLTKVEAQGRLRAWKALVQQSGVTCFEDFLKTLDERMEIITNYFGDRHSSGFVEGLNNKIKVIKRRCYGIFNVGHFFQRLMIDLRGYELFT